MSKGFLAMDMPGCCLECPLCYKADKLSLGDFRYQILYRCRMEPDDIEEVYLKDIIHKRQDWCPLKPMPEKMECPAMNGANYEAGWNAYIDAIGGNESE